MRKTIGTVIIVAALIVAGSVAGSYFGIVPDVRLQGSWEAEDSIPLVLRPFIPEEINFNVLNGTGMRAFPQGNFSMAWEQGTGRSFSTVGAGLGVLESFTYSINLIATILTIYFDGTPYTFRRAGFQARTAR